MPAYNEREFIRYSLISIARQTIKPEIILIGDNNSTDGTAEVAKRVLSKLKLNYLIIKVKRYPWLSKLNINNVYYALTKAVKKLNLEVDYIATIEADVVLEAKYFEKLLNIFTKDPKTCIAGGKLEPLGLPEDPFPLKKPCHLWGGNRLYTWKCWNYLNNSIDIRLLPAWDTDHVILALMLGYHVYRIGSAKSWTTRPTITSFKGFPKGWVDKQHGLPFWWAMAKTIQYNMDLKYLAGFVTGKPRYNNPYLTELQFIYKQGAIQVIKEKLVGIK
jgi:glycosyltransferase involved in cell wall biosynthesis